MAMFERVLHELKTSLDLVLLREVQDYGADESSCDDTYILRKRAKIFLDILY